MNADFEALGDVVTGGLAAHAVEPSSGQGGEASSTCLNCGSALAGKHCHVCGQNGNVHRTLSAFGHELLHGVFHFEGKIFRTLPLLALKPGELTRRYVHGERARFVSPLALFLFSVFLMFAVFGMVGGPVKSDPTDVATNSAQSMADVQVELREFDAELAKLNTERAKAVAAKQSTASIDQKLAVTTKARRALVTASLSSKDGKLDWNKFGEALEVKGTVDTGIKSLDAKILHAVENPALTLYKIQSSAYKYSWSLIPLSAPLLWLLFFWRREIHLYDHMVFVTYSISFMTLLAVTLALVGAIGFLEFAVAIIAMVVPPLHLYRQMKGAYGLGRKSALLRTALLVFFITFLIIPVFGLTVLVLGIG